MPSVKTGERRDIDGIIGIVLNDNNVKIVNSVMSYKLKRGKKNVLGTKNGDVEALNFFILERERERDFSLKYWEIRPSEVFGLRRKAALRREAYMWAPALGVFDKLREVGDSPYLSFTLCLSVFMMLELFEALNGRLIGLKTWDRIIENFWDIFGQSVAVGD